MERAIKIIKKPENAKCFGGLLLVAVGGIIFGVLELTVGAVAFGIMLAEECARES